MTALNDALAKLRVLSNILASSASDTEWKSSPLNLAINLFPRNKAATAVMIVPNLYPVGGAESSSSSLSPVQYDLHFSKISVDTLKFSPINFPAESKKRNSSEPPNIVVS